MDNNDTYYERETLYKEIWAEPVTIVSRRYGVSDVALRKICRRLNIPVPTNKHWANVKAGRKSVIPKLPQSKGSDKIWRYSPYQPGIDKRKREKAEALSAIDNEDLSHIIQCCEAITVQDRLSNTHPLIRQHMDEIKSIRRERKKSSVWGYEYAMFLPSSSYYWKNSKLLDIVVPDDELPRAYRLLNTAFHAIEKDLGGNIVLIKSDYNRATPTIVKLLGVDIQIRLRVQQEHWTFIIEHSLAPRRRWRDTENKKLKEEVGSFVLGIYKCALANKARTEKRAREAAEQQRLLEEEKEQQAMIQCERERYDAFEKAAMDWHKAQILDSYIDAPEEKAHEETDADMRAALMKKIEWARNKVAWLNPLVGFKDPILGRRR